jgi:hypothetical protein
MLADLDASGGDPLVNVELEAIFRYFCELERSCSPSVHGHRSSHAKPTTNGPTTRPPLSPGRPSRPIS